MEIADLFMFNTINSAKLIYVFIISLIMSKWVFTFLKDRNKLPPGPYGVPLLGYIKYWKEDFLKTLNDLSAKYGNIYSFKLFTSNVIVTTDYNIAKEILCNPLTFARPPFFLQIAPAGGGFASLNGPEWQEQRRFCIATMKELGIGRGQWEEMIQEDSAEFVDLAATWKGEPTDFRKAFTMSQVSNNLALLIGRRLKKDLDNPDIRVLLDVSKVFMQSIAPTSLLSIIPLRLAKILAALRIGKLHEVLTIMDNFGNILWREVADHQRNTEPRPHMDFIDIYLQKIREMNALNVKHSYTVENLVGNMATLFLAGSDSTLVSLHWLILIMASRPDIQQKVHDEIDNVLNKEQRLCWEDRSKLTYTYATIMEMERWIAINPTFPPRLALGTFVVQNYTIPEGSVIIGYSKEMMRDPKYIDDPEVFRPERFISDNKLIKVQGYYPFSFGKRNCPGDFVAMMTIFIYFGALMRKFCITPVNGEKISFEGEFSTVVHPKHNYPLHFLER